MSRAEFPPSPLPEGQNSEQQIFGEGGILDQYTGEERISFGEYQGTLNQAMEECPHLRALPKEALEAVLTATVVVDEKSAREPAAESSKKKLN